MERPLAPIQIPQLQATKSFLETQEGQESPPAMGSIKTPGPPDVAAARWRKGAMSQSRLREQSGDHSMGSCPGPQGRRVSLADSLLSDAPTHEGQLQRSVS